MSNCYRTLSQHLNDLKKENFSLKLRIYFLEERIQQKHEHARDEVYQKNIELKVEVESLKQELQEKQQFIGKVLTTGDTLTSHHEGDLQLHSNERQQEIDHMQEVLETKIHLLQAEAKLARDEAERMACLVESQSQRCVTLEKKLKETTEIDGPLHQKALDEKDRVINELTETLISKEALITALTGEKAQLHESVRELKDRTQDLSASLKQKDRDSELLQDKLAQEKLRIQQETQKLIEEQQSQLNQYECAAGQCVSELQKAQLQVQSLQAKIQERETENLKLQEKLYEMESELRSVKQASEKQERTIQSLNDTVSSKSSEAEELLSVIEGQKDMLCKLKETVNRHHLETLQGSTVQPPPLQGELLALQSSLFSSQLELQSSQRAQQQSLRQVADVTRARDRLQSDLQEALRHWEATEKHNQEMRRALTEARADLQERRGQVREMERQRQAEVETRDKSIQQLRQSLRDKQQLLQEYSDLLEHQQDPSQTRDAMLDKLKSRIKDRDRALERAIDEKFCCLEEKEGEVRRLQQALREKETDQEKLRCVLSNNEETILHLDRLAQGKQLQVEQMSAVSRNMQQSRQQAEERLSLSLRERDSIISQLQATLHTHTKEAQGLRDAVLSKSPAGNVALQEQLRLQLQLKESLFQQLLSDRSAQAQQHQSELQELLHTIGTRDQSTQDCAARLGQVIGQQVEELQELRRQLVCKERAVRELSREKEQQGWDPQLEIKRLQSQLQEKEAFIQELMQDSPACQEEPMITSRPSEELARSRSHKGLGPLRDMQAVQEELHLVMKKEKEAQVELCSLRSLLAQHKEEMQTQASELEALTRSVNVKEQLIKDLQTQLVEPSGLPLVDRLTQELQELRDSVAKQNMAHPDPQSTLEQLVSDYRRLNDALRSEKQLYLNLTQIHSNRDNCEKSRALQAELGRVEALRAQLEEALRRVRDSAPAPQRAAKTQADSGELSGEEEDDDDNSSDCTDIIEEEEGAQLTAETLASSQGNGFTCTNGAGGLERSMLSQHATKDGQALAKVQKLLEQKKIVEHELGELKFQLEKAGYTSLSQMRTALLSLRVQTDQTSGPKESLTRRKEETGGAGGRSEGRQRRCFPEEEQEEEEEEDEEHSSVTAEWLEAGGELSPAQGKRSAPYLQLREGYGKRRCDRPLSLDLGALLLQRAENTSAQEAEPGEEEDGFWWDTGEGLREKTRRLHSDLTLSRQQSRHLQERLIESEATVQAQAEQLKEFRELLSETSVQQDSKQVQVDLQDLGYETCGRSENEAEREGASSPEFDDLEMCTALSRDECRREWWSGNSGSGEDVASLRQHVEELRAQLSRSQATVRTLQSRMRSLSTTSDYASSLERPRKVNWGFQASPAPSGLEEDEGWQSDGLGTPRSQRCQELQELVSRVASLEDQLNNSRPEGRKAGDDAKSATKPGKFDSLIQAQARELSHLRQRLRDGRGVCHVLTQHLGDTTKSFEELLRANDIDYYMGQSFREQLAQSGALAERISAKISGREQSELPDDKMGHELLAIRLSKELQQKDKIIETLRSKLKQERSDTPSSSHALSETSDQSDRTSFVSDDQGSAHGDLDLGLDVDAVGEYATEGRPSPRQRTQTDSYCHSGTTPKQSSLSSSSTVLHGAQSCISCPSMPCTQHMDSPGQKGLSPGPVSSSLPPPQTHYSPDLSGQRARFTSDPHSALLRPGYHSAGAFSLAEVHQELQMLQRQLGESERFAVPHPHVKALSGFPLAAHTHPNHGTFVPLSYHAFPQHQFSSPGASFALKADPNLLQNSALWDMAHISQPFRTSPFGDVSSGSSGYQSGNNHTGVDLMEEHLKEIRSLRQRLEDSIRTNDRLRQQLEDRLGTTGREGGAPTNIYIQGLDSTSQLSNENRALKEENMGLHAQLQLSNKEKSKEVEQLREAVLAARARLKEAELGAEQWKEESRRLQARGSEHAQEVQQLRQDRHAAQENINRLQHQVNVLQQQLSESRQLLQSLQCELQACERASRATKDPHPVGSGAQEKPSSPELGDVHSEVRSLRAQLEHSLQENSALRAQLEKQLGRSVARIEIRRSSAPRDGGCRKQLFHDHVPSQPVRDTGPFNTESFHSVFSKASELDDPKVVDDDILETHPVLEGGAPDGSFANKKGRHAVGHVDDFRALQQQVLEGKVLVQKMESMLQATFSNVLLGVSSGKGLDYSCIDSLLPNAKTLGQILDEAASLLKMFWKAALPSSEISTQHSKKVQSMKEEIKQLKKKITEQDELLQETAGRLQSSNRTKQSMEHFIASQLSRTRDVLKKARTNLEKNECRISSLSSSSSSPCSGEIPRRPSEAPPEWGLVSTRPLASARGGSYQWANDKHNAQHLLQLASY